MLSFSPQIPDFRFHNKNCRSSLSKQIVLCGSSYQSIFMSCHLLTVRHGIFFHPVHKMVHSGKGKPCHRVGTSIINCNASALRIRQGSAGEYYIGNIPVLLISLFRCQQIVSGTLPSRAPPDPAGRIPYGTHNRCRYEAHRDKSKAILHLSR